MDRKIATRANYLEVKLISLPIAVVVLLLALALCGVPDACGALSAIQSRRAHQEGDTIEKFSADMEAIRRSLKIPGMSVALVRDQELIWAGGFGYADLEKQVAATPDTPYGLASVTKPISAVLIMGLVEEGLVDLDAPVKAYGLDLGDERITVRHLLTHTAEGVPGTSHTYNGNLYGHLASVIEAATGESYAALLSERLLLPLGLQNTALNPISSWGNRTLLGTKDFLRMLGWGKDYEHYQYVYTHLAQPYQLDDQYNIIPGMYHLYHNTAAGLISSVSDLAKFDIALDRGELLGEAAKAEMFSPAFSTYENHSDLMYGLGWYVQEFEGLRLLWHTGRWPPSTSALYLKVPDENLTMIVLANTDNLTVPFNSIGNGDVTKSILALSFFRHFIFPAQHGFSLPDIDWEAGEVPLIHQLSEIEDGDARQFLERELWSYRQVFASVGRMDQVGKLERVSRRAYPHSVFRSDWLFTSIPGRNPVIAPAVRAVNFIWLSRGVLIWFGLVFLSLLWMAVRVLPSKELFAWRRVIWLLSALFLGPLAIWAHTCNSKRPYQDRAANRGSAWQASALLVAGYALGWALAIILLIRSRTDLHPLAILGCTYLLPLLSGIFIVRLPLLLRQEQGSLKRVLITALLSEFIGWNIGYAVFFPLTILINERVLTTLPGPYSPFFWAVISSVSIAGVVTLVPLQAWMLRCGLGFPSGSASTLTAEPSLLDLRSGRSVLLTSLVIMVAALAVTIGQMN